jgi:hypothetical protein
LIFLSSTSLFAQIGIGTNVPHESSILEIKSSTKGFLPPRLTIAQRNSILNPSDGLMVYCYNCCPTGDLTVYNGNEWISMTACSVENDNDSDGVPSDKDIDWDNDGIINSLENFQTQIPFSIPDGANAQNTPTSKPSSFELKIYSIGNMFAFALYDGVTPNFIHPIYSTYQLDYSQTNIASTIYLTTDGVAPSSNNKIENPSVTNTNGLARLRLHIDSSGRVRMYATKTSTSNNEVEVFPSDGSNFGTLLPAQLNYLVLNHSSTGNDIINCEFVFHFNDPDGDGIINALDLDSDNDGCSDAYEAGFTTDNTTNYSFSNYETGSNGLANTLETSDDSGATIHSPNTTRPYNSVLSSCP